MEALTKTIRNSIKQWYLPLIAGILLILAGIWTLKTPQGSYLVLSMFFSTIFIIIGLLESIFSIVNREELDNWGWWLVLGLLTIAVGILMFIHPEISMITLPLYIGFILLFRSFSAISTSIEMRDYGDLNWGYLLTLGILGVLFSFILIWNPVFAGLSLVIWTGTALLTAGIFNIYISFRLKKLGGK